MWRVICVSVRVRACVVAVPCRAVHTTTICRMCDPSDGPVSTYVPSGNPIPSVSILVIPLLFPFLFLLFFLAHPPRPPYSARAPAEKKGRSRPGRPDCTEYNLRVRPLSLHTHLSTHQGAKADNDDDAGTGQPTNSSWSTVWTFLATATATATHA